MFMTKPRIVLHGSRERVSEATRFPQSPVEGIQGVIDAPEARLTPLDFLNHRPFLALELTYRMSQLTQSCSLMNRGLLQGCPFRVKQLYNRFFLFFYFLLLYWPRWCCHGRSRRRRRRHHGRRHGGRGVGQNAETSHEHATDTIIPDRESHIPFHALSPSPVFIFPVLHENKSEQPCIVVIRNRVKDVDPSELDRWPRGVSAPSDGRPWSGRWGWWRRRRRRGARYESFRVVSELFTSAAHRPEDEHREERRTKQNTQHNARVVLADIQRDRSR